jgi:hypothetical protein
LLAKKETAVEELSGKIEEKAKRIEDLMIEKDQVRSECYEKLEKFGYAKDKFESEIQRRITEIES